MRDTVEYRDEAGNHQVGRIERVMGGGQEVRYTISKAAGENEEVTHGQIERKLD
ncbi:hypothetical protein [Streptomyces sp. NPDC051109]|uniref:hypothetical protein n=1 Tax=Streptomyces sp. NPDC051109 TaxID=3365642 RepID=UPI001416FB9E